MKERTAANRHPRPVYYTRDQLDELCEQIIVGFCMARCRQELNLISNEVLLQLLEEYTHDVDETADLRDSINGVTEYYWDRKPPVKIDARLTQQHWRETRWRTTLCPECSHAIYHAPLGPENPGDGPIFTVVSLPVRRAGTLRSVGRLDGGQARHVSKGFLMPKTRVGHLAQRGRNKTLARFRQARRRASISPNTW
jgi:hypothetical protein